MSIKSAQQPKQHAFRKILIANRGEIARRIMRSVRELGIASVAVYSDADADAPHVKEADEAVRLGPAPSAESYLSIERILNAARAVGADAIHPGYGFLSERADFAQACVDAGFTLIGPSPTAIARMGSKIESKRIAAQAGVPVIEGFSAEGFAEAEIVTRANALGYPILIKASAGGGGRGMRIVRAASELQAALSSAQREASAAFGDGSLLIERYIDSPRHVEVQIFGDHYGHVIHCFERECSIQRRHQKVIEEAPSPALEEALRKRMGDAAVALGRVIGYSGAGTVEFVLDQAGAFFFLEVNTRLQVEHPVTEAITGLDLVRMQIEVAQGAPLALQQGDLAITGHAIEARLYAEDPARDFLPVTGRVALFERPARLAGARSRGLRIDSGVEVGSEVSVHYDPMLAKVIAHGASREQARQRLVQGLRALGIAGLTTNRDFLVDVLEHPSFASGETDTHFIERHFPAEKRGASAGPTQHPLAHVHAIAATLYLHAQRRARPSPIPVGVPSGFRNNRYRKQEQRFALEGGGAGCAVRYSARAENEGGVFDIETEGFSGSAKGTKLHARVIDATASSLTAEIDSVRRRFTIAHEQTDRQERVIVHTPELCLELIVVPRFPLKAAALLAGGCVAPMTGVVRKVCVAVGDRVARGDLLLMLEAMKMEHRLLAQTDGVVSAVRVREGQMVDPDEVLVVVVAQEAQETQEQA